MGTQTNQRNTNEYTKYKPRLNTQKTLGPTRLYELVLVAAILSVESNQNVESKTKNVESKTEKYGVQNSIFTSRNQLL